MGLVIRQTIKSSIGMAVGAVLGGLLMLSQTKLMDQQEYGFTKALGNYSTFFAVLIAFGIQTTLSVFLHRFEHDQKKKSSLIFLSVVVPSMALAVITLPFYLFRFELAQQFDKVEDGQMFLRYFWTIPTFTLACMLVLILEQTLLAYQKTSINTWLKEVILRGVNILLVLFLAAGFFYYVQFIWLWTFAYIGLLLTIILFARRFHFLPFRYYKGALSKEDIRELFRFSYFHWFLNFSHILLGYLDGMMLAPLDKNGLNSVAVYGNATFLISLLSVAYRPLWQTAYPSLVRAYEQNDPTLLRSLFFRSTLNIQIVAILMWSLLVCNLDNAVYFMGEGYEAVASITLILSLSRLVDMFTSMNDAMLSITKLYRYFFYFTVMNLVVLVGLYYFTIPLFGMYGAAWSTTAMITLFNVIKWWLLKKKLHMDTFRPQTWRILLIGLLACSAGYFMPQFENVYIDVLVRSLLICLLFGVGLMVAKPSQDIEQIIQNILKRKKLF